MNICPHTNTIHAIRQNHTKPFYIMCAELIDNSLDANARNVHLDLSQKDRLVVRDDGIGLPSMAAIFRLGERAGHATTRSGRFAIGTKESAICLGSRFEVTSVRDGLKQIAYADWDAIMAHGQWEIDDPVITPVPPSESTGVEITIRGLIRRKPPTKELLEQFSRLYGLILSVPNPPRITLYDGKALHQVIATPLPDMKSAINFTVDLPHSKALSITAGLLIRPEDMRLEGITIVLEGSRMVASKTRLGLPGATPGLYGLVRLRGTSWEVARNKDGISERDADLIADIIRQRCSELIDLARKQNQMLHLAEMQITLQRTCTLIKQERRKARRLSPVNAVGTIEPKHTSQRHKRANNHQPGDTFTISVPTPSPCIEIQPQPRTPDEPLFCLEGNSIIVVNTDHPVFHQCGQNLAALEPSMITYYATQVVLRGWKDQLPFKEDDDNKAIQADYSVSKYLEAYYQAKSRSDERNIP